MTLKVEFDKNKFQYVHVGPYNWLKKSLPVEYDDLKIVLNEIFDKINHFLSKKQQYVLDINRLKYN